MRNIADWPCWMIMNCGTNKANCPAFLQPERPCWVIAREESDYRWSGNVCRDCLVCVVKNNCSVLTEQERAAITALKYANLAEEAAFDVALRR